MSEIEENPITPAIVAILAGGGAVAWMLWQNGLGMFTHWFFYPGISFLVLTVVSLMVGLNSRFSRVIWTACLWWSGFWMGLFMLTWVAVPFSIGFVLMLVAPILGAAKIDPFLAAFLHILIWACAKDILKRANKSSTRIPA